VCGLRWSDVSFTDGTLSIRQTHVTVGGEVIEKGPKSRRGYRVLPLFQPVLGALLALYETQLAEARAAGAAYAGTVDDGFVACDELGAPVNPQTYPDAFARLCRANGLPKIRLHDCRHSTNSLLEHLGVSPSIRASWFGHTVAVNTGTYTHASAADLAVVSGALGGLFSGAV
jgi:integrase